MEENLKHQIEKIIASPTSNEREILLRLKQLIYEKEFQNIVVRESENISGLVEENLTRLLRGVKDYNIIKSGFRDFDITFGGFSQGELVIIGGRPSMGKTQLLINLSLNMAQEHPVLYFTFDLPKPTLVNRFLAAVSGIAAGNIIQQDLSAEQKGKLKVAGKTIAACNIFINDSCSNSVTQLKKMCEKHIRENGVKVIILDYLQLMSSAKYKNNREVEISYISRELKNIARELDVCVIASSQMSRAVEMRTGEKKPHLSDLRESGAIEQDADKVIFIFRPEYYGMIEDREGNCTEGIVEIIMAKNRNGGTGSIQLMIDKDFTRFMNFTGYKNNFEFSKNRLRSLLSPDSKSCDESGSDSSFDSPF